jgi:hypothetical protein
LHQANDVVLIAENAGTHIRRVTFAQFEGKFRIGDQGTGHLDGIGLLLRQQGCGHLRLDDAALGDHRYGHRGFDDARQMGCETGRHVQARPG